MVCHHTDNDTNCSSHPSNVEAREYAQYLEQQKVEAEKKAKAERDAMTPDAKDFEIADAIRIGNHLVLKVLYPNCSKCAYEGNKVMVFLNITETQALRWKKIDPHFRAPSNAAVNEAPSPAARFPASEEGWKDALDYAKGKK